MFARMKGERLDVGYRLAFHAVIVSIFSLAFAFPSIAESNDDEPRYRFPRDQRDLELKEVADGLVMGFAAGTSAYREEFEGVARERAVFEGLELEFEFELTNKVILKSEFGYDHEDTRDVVFEEIVGTWGWENEATWMVEVGRMELPMGEYNSNFVEDPTTVLIGETFDEAVLVGYETELLEIALAGYKGDFNDENFVFALNIIGIDNLEMGFFVSDNLGESLELRELRREALEEAEEGGLKIDKVAGYGAFFAWGMAPFIVDFEWIAAMDRFAEGTLDDSASKPQAWNFEIAARPASKWQVGVRFEHSKDVSDAPKRQYGFAFSYGISENLMLTGNYLRGEFEDDHLKRDLFQVELVFEY